jgi:hypothetical protein
MFPDAVPPADFPGVLRRFFSEPHVRFSDWRSQMRQRITIKRGAGRRGANENVSVVFRRLALLRPAVRTMRKGLTRNSADEAEIVCVENQLCDARINQDSARLSR